MNEKLFTIKGALREGWELTKVNIGFLVVFQIILFFLAWLFSDTDNNWRAATPINLIGLIIVILGKMGFYQSALLLTKGLKPSFEQLYSNWRLFPHWIIAGFLFTIMFAIGLILFIVPGLYIWATFGFYPFFILDKGSGPIECLKQSAEATQGIRWHVFLLFLVCTALDLLGLLFFGVGILIAAPVTLIALATVYRQLTGQSKNSIQPDDITPHLSDKDSL
jgi:uncharacterized membrane protein